MQDFLNKKIVLGICGGVAAYKSAYLARELIKLGASVRVVMTESAQQFITPWTFQALTGNEVRTSLFDSQAERAMGHIELARWADYLIIAPASADYLAKMAQGLANDLLSTLYLVATIPVFVCPAMNHSMWNHEATQANCATLKQRGVVFVGPEEGDQACGEFGLGRLSEATPILNALRLYKVRNNLAGQTVMITAGATKEPIDPVRYITNRSSAKMGYALAEAALMAGAKVILVAGPNALKASYGIDVIKVETAKEMKNAVMENFKAGMVFIGAAAVSDYSVVKPAKEKIKKQDMQQLNLALTLNDDILAEVAASGKSRMTVGFAAETNHVLDYARKKLKDKKLDMIIANEVGSGMGFESDVNKVTVLSNTHHEVLPLEHKVRLAGRIISMIAASLGETQQKNRG